MNKNLLKTLLLTAAFAMGANSLWADEGDVTTNADIDFSNSITSSTDDDGNTTYYVEGTTNSMILSNVVGSHPLTVSADSALLIVGNGSGTVTISEDERAGSTDVVVTTFDLAFGKLSGGYINFGFYDADGNSLGEFSFCPYSGTLTNDFGVETDDMYYGYNTVIWDRKVSFTITYDYLNSTITTETSCYKSGSSKSATTASHDAAMLSTNPIATFVISSTYTNDDRRCYFDNLTINTTEGTEAETATYTIKKVNEDGESIADDVTLSGEVDSEITLADSYKEDFFNDDETIKYIYSSDDSDGKTIASDNSTEVTITYREAGNYSYALYASVNGETTELGSGSYFEGETVYVPYPYYMNSDGTLYYYGATSSQYRYPITLESESNEVTLTYTESTITNVIFLSEGEDIDGVTIINSGNSEIRSSNAACGSSAGEDVTIITLPAGTYTITGAYYAVSSGLSLTLSAGSTELLSVSTTAGSNWTSFSVEVSIEETTAITFNSSSNMAIDFVYVVAESYAKTIPSYGYVSFSAPLAVEVPADVTVYKATNVGDDAVTLEEVSTGVIPANEGVILGGEAADYTLAVISEDSDGDFSDNILIASSVYPTVGSDEEGYTTYYGLNAGAESDAEFAQIEDGIILSTNKAYLGVSSESSAKTLKITFGSTTGISEAAVESASSDGAIYSLQGIKVSSPSKGLYIQDGKKVIIK